MRIILALILIGHGFAHLSGFFVSWRIATFQDTPYKTTILAKSIDIGDLGIRVVGILWLVAALAFPVSAIAVLAQASWWLLSTSIVMAFSFLLCVLEWPEARIGAFVNLAVAALILVGRHMNWFG